MSKKNPPLTVDSVVDKYAALVDKYDALTDKYLALKGDNERAKPKKELIVPWEWIADDCVSLCVNEAKVVFSVDCNGHLIYMTGFKLDLDGIDLPVTVERPKC